MKYSLPDIFRKSRSGSMSHDEIYWIEQQVRHVPYFQLHQTVLAQQEHVVPGGNPFIERGLLYSTNRKSMAALMAQDQDVFIPSPENKVLQPSKPNATIDAPAIEIPETLVIPEDVESIQPFVPEITSEEVESMQALEQNEQPEKSEGPEADVSRTSSDDVSESVDVILPSDAAEHAEADPIIVTGFVQSNTTDTLVDVPVVPDTPRPEVLEAEATSEDVQEIQTKESDVEIISPKANNEIQTEAVKPFRVNDKLEHRVQFRVQMFGWKAVMIRQEIETYKEQITGSKESSGKQSADFVISHPRKTIALPEVPVAMENTFVPDFKVEESDLTYEAPAIPEEETSSVQLDLVSDTFLPEIAQGAEPAVTEIPLEAAKIESDTDEEALPFRHNNLDLDIIIHPSAHSKYLRKPSMDLQMHPAPRKEFVNLSTEVNTLPAKRRANRQRTLELIDKFIENESDLAIKPVMTEGKSVDISKPSVSDDSEIVSETLAQIYLKQGNKQKAIRIYQKLMLKFPEKSSYFESLLRNL
jgi:hypothetical protein